MLDLFRQRLHNGMSEHAKRNSVREVLQIVCLKIMSEARLFERVSFLGGTALRIVHGVRRFSEDMDFSLLEGKSISLEEVEAEFKRKVPLYGLSLETNCRTVGAVYSIALKFPGVLNAAGISGHTNEKLMIKWDVDTNPPVGAGITHSILDNLYLFAVAHYDLPSLFAGKLHACFFRKYTKGRDWYDFVWYMMKKVAPNYLLLNNAIMQTQKKDYGLDKQTIQAYMRERIAHIDFRAVRNDVRPFLEDEHEVEILKKEYIEKLIDDMKTA